ncbi:MAG: RiPP maturation radical SAM protein 1 [Nitrospirales bacterium]|nr:RiPP maturation radical SAM protein 1 [Nitrospirales bacterium]
MVETVDVIIVVPPFAVIDRPSLGPSLLKAGCQNMNIRTKVIYAGLSLASGMGFQLYADIALSSSLVMPGEWLFSKAAFGEKSRYSSYADSIRQYACLDSTGMFIRYSIEDLLSFQSQIDSFVEATAEKVLSHSPTIVGFSSMFQQTCAAIDIARGIKKRRPDVVTVIGGANCSQPMGKAILDTTPHMDYVFSGESDLTFPEFCKKALSGELPSDRVIHSNPIQDLDILPFPDHRDYFSQITDLPEHAASRYWVTFETSRGCWWGEHRTCRFCGLNHSAVTFRKKSPPRAIREIRHLLDQYGVSHLEAVDNILPQGYIEQVWSHFTAPSSRQKLFYEIRPTLSFDELRGLKNAGLFLLQPGIESLSDDILSLIGKGLSAAGNIAFLRDCRLLDLKPIWNFLTAVPNALPQYYEEMEKLIPFIEHLPPPVYINPIGIQRYSAYFDHPDDYGIRHIRPQKSYSAIFPDTADINALACFFETEYDSELSDADLAEKFETTVTGWQNRWADPDNPKPVLTLIPLTEAWFLLEDTRSIAERRFSVVPETTAGLLKAARIPISYEKLADTFLHESGGISAAEFQQVFEELTSLGMLIKAGNKIVSLVCEPARCISESETRFQAETCESHRTGLS